MTEFKKGQMWIVSSGYYNDFHDIVRIADDPKPKMAMMETARVWRDKDVEWDRPRRRDLSSLVVMLPENTDVVYASQRITSMRNDMSQRVAKAKDAYRANVASLGTAKESKQ